MQIGIGEMLTGHGRGAVRSALPARAFALDAWILLLVLAASPLFPAFASKPVMVANGVYAILGDNGDITPENQGEVANAGFIAGKDAVVAIDTGVSFAAGKRMREWIAGTTNKPIEQVVLTHAAQEFIFGAAAFQRHGIPLTAHAATADLIQQRCLHCLKNLLKLLGSEIMRDSAVVLIDRPLTGSTQIDPGQRRIDLLHYGWASTPGDLAVFDRKTGTLFAGGLVTAQRIPNLRDGKIDGWIAALVVLRKLPVTKIVPGFGPVGGKEEIDRMLAYLRQLKAAVGRRYREGSSLIEAMKTIDLPAFRNWHGYESTHAQNVLYLYRQFEDTDFRSAPPADTSSINDVGPREASWAQPETMRSTSPRRAPG